MAKLWKSMENHTPTSNTVTTRFRNALLYQKWLCFSIIPMLTCKRTHIQIHTHTQTRMNTSMWIQMMKNSRRIHGCCWCVRIVFLVNTKENGSLLEFSFVIWSDHKLYSVDDVANTHILAHPTVCTRRWSQYNRENSTKTFMFHVGVCVCVYRGAMFSGCAVSL